MSLLRGESGSPRLAVVIPCFNEGELLREAVESAERSIPEPAELVLVNDGSVHAPTLAVLDDLRQRGYTVLDPGHGGSAAARNHGFAASSADYLLPLDADNRLLPGFTTSALAVLDREPRVAAVYGDRHDFGDRDEIVRVPDFDLDALLAFNTIDTCALVRRVAWREAGGYDTALPHECWEDWELWLAVAARGWELRHLPQVAFEYRWREASKTERTRGESERRDIIRYVVAKHHSLYWERLPEAMLAAQRASIDLAVLSRRKQGDDAAAADYAASLIAEVERAHAEVERAHAEVERARTELEAARAVAAPAPAVSRRSGWVSFRERLAAVRSRIERRRSRTRSPERGR
jgi:GT2 family glycosyltransferase